MSKQEEQTKIKHRDRYTISFRPKKVNKPMNKIINGWIEIGESPTDKIVETIIESNKLNYCAQTRKFKNVFTSIYNSLSPIYGEGEELYVAIDEVLNEILDINLTNLFDLIQVKIDEKTAPHLIKPKKETKEPIDVSVQKTAQKDSVSNQTSVEEKQKEIVSKPKVESVPQDELTSILVNGVETKVTYTPDKVNKVKPSSSTTSASSSEVDFFGSAGNDFFSSSSI